MRISRRRVPGRPSLDWSSFLLVNLGGWGTAMRVSRRGVPGSASFYAGGFLLGRGRGSVRRDGWDPAWWTDGASGKTVGLAFRRGFVVGIVGRNEAWAVHWGASAELVGLGRMVMRTVDGVVWSVSDRWSRSCSWSRSRSAQDGAQGSGEEDGLLHHAGGLEEKIKREERMARRTRTKAMARKILIAETAVR